jgi:phosphohistidine phosphatase SixA
LKIYFMRHCLADDGPQMDADRGLTNVGELQAKVMRKFLDRADVDPDIVISSDFKRALQTVDLLKLGDTPHVITPALRPDGTCEKAWKAILKATKDLGDKPSVLVVTHGPFIQELLASVAFQFGNFPWNHFTHGAIAYVNTHESCFRWFVNPKLAARMVGADPQEVENPLAEAQTIATDLKRLSENLMAKTKRAQIAPLRDQARAAVTKRWNRQSIRVRKVLKNMRPDIDGGADAAFVTAMLQAALPATDDKFAKAHHAVRTAAYQTGANHVVSQLGDLVAFGSRVGEAKKPTPLPANIPEPEDTSDVLEAQLDNTTADRMKTALLDVSPWTYVGALAAVRGMFKDFGDAPEGQLSRADTVALDTVSNAYHEGANAVAQSAQDVGVEVEKMWDVGSGGCEAICQPNAEEGWIPFDSPHDSGDFEPPAHPNCDCSESYRTVGTDEGEE